MHRYRDLLIWQRSLKFVKPVYKIAEKLPVDEKYCLMQQMKRAAYSISMNISEGAERRTDKDFSHFLDMAIGSLHEVENCILVAIELSFLREEETSDIFCESEEILRMILEFQNKLNSK